MKKIILIVLALVTIQVSAQERKQDYRKGERKERINRFKDFSPEEVAELQTKRMTLDLDLTPSQQKQIQKLNLENAINRRSKMDERQAKMKEGNKEAPNKEERLKMMNERLDRQIEMKQKMAKILNSDQMEKWEKMKKRNKGKKFRKQKELKGKRS